MLYRLTVKWEVSPESLLSNHYGPQYYGIGDPEEYLEWVKSDDIRLWMYYGDRGDLVWSVFEENYPGVLVTLFGEPREGTYLVDRGLVDSLL